MEPHGLGYALEHALAQSSNQMPVAARAMSRTVTDTSTSFGAECALTRDAMRVKIERLMIKRGGRDNP